MQVFLVKICCLEVLNDAEEKAEEVKKEGNRRGQRTERMGTFSEGGKQVKMKILVIRQAQF